MSLERDFQNCDDFAAAARRRLPCIFADYIDGGAFAEQTMQRNRSDFGRWALRQRVLLPLDAPDLSVPLGTSRAALPFGLAPVGFLGLYRRDGDIALARAASFVRNMPAPIRSSSAPKPPFGTFAVTAATQSLLS